VVKENIREINHFEQALIDEVLKHVDKTERDHKVNERFDVYYFLSEALHWRQVINYVIALVLILDLRAGWFGQQEEED
jgi:hypothetical protein